MSRLKVTNNICAIIPFYDEKQFIRSVVLESIKYVDEIIAVNDGSNDDSQMLIKDLEHVNVINFKFNFGKGKALQAGFDECVKHDYDFIVTLDGDNQHDPKYIPEFINKLNDFDIIIGNRLANTKAMPFQRILSNRITSFLLSLKIGQNIIDSQCGFRAYKKEVLQKIRTSCFGYEAESEILIYAARKGFKIGFVNISTIYGDEKSKMNPMYAVLGFIKVLFK